MTNTANTTRPKLNRRYLAIRSAILSASLLGFLPVFTFIRADATPTTDAPNSTELAVAAPAVRAYPSLPTARVPQVESVQPKPATTHSRTRAS